MHLTEIQTKIYELRGLKVMLDSDLAEMYQVETRVLKQAVRRNINRFPTDFMFELNDEDVKCLTSQIVILEKQGRGKYSKFQPFAFTEQGVAMLSSVLNSEKAIEVNIAIIRAFVFLRQYALTHKDLTDKLHEMEKKYDRQFKDIYEAINYLIQKDKSKTEHNERKKIGY